MKLEDNANVSFSDVVIEREKCCQNCDWFNIDYPNSDSPYCMYDPPVVVIMKNYEGEDVVRTVHPSPKYPSIDFCSRFQKKENTNDHST